MEKTKKGYRQEWNDYYGQGVATTYYRYEDVALEIIFSGGKRLSHAETKLEEKWNDFFTLGEFISERVKPYRVVLKNK